jgi:hypothetical protein
MGRDKEADECDTEPALSFAKAHATYETGGLVGIMKLGIGAVV